MCETKTFHRKYREAARSGHWWFEGRTTLVKGVLSSHGIVGGLVADLGSGAADLFPESFRVIRVDLELQETRRDFVLADVRRLPFRADIFEGVGLFDVLEHLADPKPVLSEVARVLHPGGFLLVTVPAHPWLWSLHDQRVGHVTRYSRHRLEELLRRAGFSLHWSNYFFGFLVVPALVRKWLPLGTDFEMPRAGLNDVLRRVARRSARKAVLRRRSFLGLSLAALAYQSN